MQNCGGRFWDTGIGRTHRQTVGVNGQAFFLEDLSACVQVKNRSGQRGQARRLVGDLDLNVIHYAINHAGFVGRKALQTGTAVGDHKAITV